MWYFDTKIKRCRQFYYGGCGGNENRFASETDCEQRCRQTDVRPPPPTPEPITRQTHPYTQPTRRPTIARQRDHCLLSTAQGGCEERLRRYYYDKTYGICTQFLYTGCDGNENNFETLEECESLCDDAVELCDLAPLAGSCEQNLTKWYFDSYTRRCHEFEYTGCYGNKNNFDDQRSCEHACHHKQETAETQAPEPEPPRRPSHVK